MRLAAPAVLLLLTAACVTVEDDAPDPVPMAGVGVHACTTCAPWMAEQACCRPGEDECPRCGLATAPNEEGAALCCNTAVVGCARCGRRMAVMACCG